MLPGHILTGPIAVRDAEPGDVLEVDILDVTLRQDWGYNLIRPLAGSSEGVRELAQSAKRAGYDWVFVDTPPNMSAIVTDAISVATLIIIPARLTLFDLAAIKETMVLARQLNKPYAVVINGVPPRRDNTESPFVREARAVLTSLNVPVWSGQITQRNNYSLALAEGESACEYDSRSG